MHPSIVDDMLGPLPPLFTVDKQSIAFLKGPTLTVTFFPLLHGWVGAIVDDSILLASLRKDHRKDQKKQNLLFV